MEGRNMMDKRSRTYKIYNAAMSIQAEWPAEQDSLLQAIAAMLDYATAKRVPAKDKKPLIYTEQDVIRQLSYDFSITRHGRLNGVLKTLSLEGEDLEKIRVWFSESMFPWMLENEVELTYSMLCRKYPEWLERARQYKGSAKAKASVTTWR